MSPSMSGGPQVTEFVGNLQLILILPARTILSLK